MRIQIVVPSISKLENIYAFKEQFLNSSHEINIEVIDEGDQHIREHNRSLLRDLKVKFHGPVERAQWFRERFGSSYKEKLAVIPERCHAETSFGFLLAVEEQPDIVIEIDDDVFPVKGQNLIELHLRNLSESDGEMVTAKSAWYNTLEALDLEGMYATVFPRGHPYHVDARSGGYTFSQIRKATVLNMGHWIGNLDLDAPTLLYHGGLDGRCGITAKGLKRQKVIVGPGTFFAVCSMNTAFTTKVVPAFYQLYMNYEGVDRFDDIWSGIFLKKVADSLGDSMSLGVPLVRHDKRSRNVFKDLRSELEGIIMNETLWRIVQDLELEGSDYYSAYASLTEGVGRRIDEFGEKRHRDFMRVQVEKMRLWLDVVDKIM